MNTGVLRSINRTVFVDTLTGYAVGSDRLIIKYVGDKTTSVKGLHETSFNLRIPILKQNYPNPAGSASSSGNPVTMIRFELDVRARCRVQIFNVFGEEITVLMDGVKGPGEYELRYDTSELPTGISFYHFRTDKGSVVMKMLVMN